MEPYKLNMDQLKRDMAQHAENAQARNDFAKESLWNVLTALLNYGEAAARKEAKMEARTILDVDQFATKEEKGEVIKVSNVEDFIRRAPIDVSPCRRSSRTADKVC